MTRPRTLVAAVAAASLTIGVLAAGSAASAAPPPKPPATPVVTRAALDPALVAGRGADVPFLEQEAENAATNGTVIGPGRDGLHDRGRGVGPQGGAAAARAVRRVHPARRRQRDHGALQHPGFAPPAADSPRRSRSRPGRRRARSR